MMTNGGSELQCTALMETTHTATGLGIIVGLRSLGTIINIIIIIIAIIIVIIIIIIIFVIMIIIFQ